MKKINKKLLILILSLVLLLLGMGNKISADALPTNQTSVEIRITNNGVPIIHTSYSAMNIEHAYEQIKSGEISEKVRNSAAWLLASQNTNSNDANEIVLSNGQKIGKGITHTDDEMNSIISGLMNVDKLSLISEINQSNVRVPFLNPEHVVYKFTNSDGSAKANIEQGYTLILDNSNNLVKLVRIQDASQKVGIDLANMDSKIKFTADSKLNDLATNFGQYVVGTNQKFSFNLSIDKETWKQAGNINLVLPPKSNLSFDSIKVLTNSDAVSMVTNPALSDAMVFNSSSPVVAANIILNPTQSDILLSVTVHVNLEGDNIGTSNPMHTSMQAVTVNKDGSSSIASTPNLVMAGANFAMTRENVTQFAQGGEFVLARTLENSYQVYGINGKWNKVDNLEELQNSDSLILKGGNRYVLGSEKSQKIPLDVSKFNFSEKNSRKINKSLIQILGLAQGEDYFLYRVDNNSPSNSDRIFKFSIFSRNYFSPNNSLMTNNSLNNPTKPLVGIVGQIPDYVAGANEYNNISLDSSKDNINKNKLSIFGGIGIVGVLVLLVSILIVKQRWL
ncbi:hypothetical protein [Lactococcus lactis]|uniref:Surface protein n=2 Tax=Lactococcus lactis TaxID=1358 RepID=A0AAP8E3G5_9LACT|nr:hypothetical protein [Lactococcus lactis]MDG4970934.1 hypothetical protein [Lactococcus lactis]PFG90207.1 hypothetical protein BW154_01095 [Lactococcus lactis]RHJ27199.1 hypothetical protein DW134_09120 [Lactococcus lactis]